MPVIRVRCINQWMELKLADRVKRPVGFGGFDDEPSEPELEQARRRTDFVAILGGTEPDDMAGWRVGR